jgi:hypothetical protein
MNDFATSEFSDAQQAEDVLRVPPQGFLNFATACEDGIVAAAKALLP